MIFNRKKIWSENLHYCSLKNNVDFTRYAGSRSNWYLMMNPLDKKIVNVIFSKVMTSCSSCEVFNVFVEITVLSVKWWDDSNRRPVNPVRLKSLGRSDTKLPSLDGQRGDRMAMNRSIDRSTGTEWSKSLIRITFKDPLFCLLQHSLFYMNAMEQSLRNYNHNTSEWTVLWSSDILWGNRINKQRTLLLSLVNSHLWIFTFYFHIETV